MSLSFDESQVNKEIYEKLLDVEYFNLEVSECGTTLVFNASKKGLETFLRVYGNLETPPNYISFETLYRSQRIWCSREIQENTKALSTDPTPYMGVGSDKRNILQLFLYIQFLDSSPEKTILAVGYKEKTGPVLVVNKNGWKKFLEMMRCLKDECYWFYVLAPRDESWSHLPFSLTNPYPGDPQDHVFKAIECIRLEPEKCIFLSPYFNYGNNIDEHDVACGRAYGHIHGNSAGLLLFSQWMHEFAESPNFNQDILNVWNDIFRSVRSEEKQDYEDELPQWLHLRKVCVDSPYPVIALGGRADKTSNFYIFANTQGFQELAQLIEKSAFTYDHNDFGLSASSEGRWIGDLTKEITVPEGVCLCSGWELLEGAFFNPAYCPYAKHRFVPGALREGAGAIASRFINERIYYGDKN